MTRTSYGPQVKNRAIRLFTAIAAFAQDELEGVEQVRIQCSWQPETDSPILIVRTTLRALEELCQKDGLGTPLTKPQIREALNHMKDFLNIFEDVRENRKGTGHWHFKLTLWSKDTSVNVNQFDQLWETKRPPKSKEQQNAQQGSTLRVPTRQWRTIFNSPSSVEPSYLSQISCERLQEQQRLFIQKQHLLLKGNEINRCPNPSSVPFRLEEYKQLSRWQSISDLEKGRNLCWQIDAFKTFDQQQFLEQVFRQKQSPKSQGQRIALIGETGVGKTTFLWQIAEWVGKELQQTVIWISLSALSGKTLEEFLLKRWLKDSLKVANISLEQENAFVEWFKDSPILLLLDGANEMSAGTYTSPLQAIAEQTKGWIGQAQIVLTCQQNIWNSHARSVAEFDTYRILEFSYPSQVEKFIKTWFAPLGESGIAQGQRFCTSLRDPGQDLIRDLVKNPLLLTFLCMNWHCRESKLPETKANLYQQIVEDFYYWKEEEFPTKKQQRQQLNTKLGEMARELIETEASRFCLPQEFLCRFLGEFEDETSSFQLALKLGWLKVEVDKIDTRKSVYTFFRSTFIEYFAAFDIVQRFERYQSLTFEQLRDDIFGLHWYCANWCEVLRLICQLIQPKSAVELIEFLIEQKPNGDDPNNPEFPYDFEMSIHFDKKEIVIESLGNRLLALDCLQDLKGIPLGGIKFERCLALLHKVTTPVDDIPLTCSSACQILGKVVKLFSTIKTYDSKPFQAIPEAIDILKLFREFFKSQHSNIKAAIILATLEYLSSDIRIIQFFQEIALLEHDSVILSMILEQLLANFGDSVEVLSWVHYQAEFSSNQSLRISATEKLSEYCEGDVATFELLCRIAMNDPFSHDHNFMDDDILWELWRKEGLSLWQKNPRLISLEAIVTHYHDHDKTFSLLENRAVKDPDLQVREFALDAIARRY